MTMDEGDIISHVLDAGVGEWRSGVGRAGHDGHGRAPHDVGREADREDQRALDVE